MSNEENNDQNSSTLLNKTRELIQFANTVSVQGERIKNFNSLLKKVCKMGENKKNKKLKIEREIAELFYNYYNKYYDQIDEFDFDFLLTIEPLIYNNSNISYPVAKIYKEASKDQMISDKFEDLFVGCIFQSLICLHKNKDYYIKNNTKYVVEKKELDEFVLLVSELN
jgi:hypothetical protein